MQILSFSNNLLCNQSYLLPTPSFIYVVNNAFLLKLNYFWHCQIETDDNNLDKELPK